MRMKGILNLRRAPISLFSRACICFSKGGLAVPWAEDEQRLNRLVFIGRDLDENHSVYDACMTNDSWAAASEGRPFWQEARRVVFYLGSDPLLGSNHIDLSARRSDRR